MSTAAWTHYLVRTAYHGGGLISRHHTLGAAERAKARLGSGECVCGCNVVVDASEYADLPDSTQTDPYSPAI